MELKRLNALEVESIVKRFRINGEVLEVYPFGSGLINDTFLVKNKNSGSDDYLLQRINHHVFKDVSGLMRNVELIISHLKRRIAANSRDDADRKALTLIPTLDDMLFYQDKNGGFWRLYVFLPGTRSYDLVTTERQAYEGGRAFGNFQFLLSDMNAGLLTETIKDFHNIKKRLADLYDALSKDVLGRGAVIREEMCFIRDREVNMSAVFNWGKEGILPQRVTHNDTKFNNVLFDENDNVQCVIDLDTVMPGLVAYDFGDAVRTIINMASEDEADIARIQLNVPLFEAYTNGYMEEAGAFLTEKEIESLQLGMMLLPYMQGVRFLTDFLNGDKYFKIAYPNHNLVRAKAQFQLLRKLESQQQTLEEIISAAAAKRLVRVQKPGEAEDAVRG